MIRSFLGVQVFKKYPQAATIKPETNALTINDTVHKKDTEKKKGIVQIKHIPIPYSITFFAAWGVLTKKPQLNKPMKWATIAGKINAVEGT